MVERLPPRAKRPPNQGARPRLVDASRLSRDCSATGRACLFGVQLDEVLSRPSCLAWRSGSGPRSRRDQRRARAATRALFASPIRASSLLGSSSSLGSSSLGSARRRSARFVVVRGMRQRRCSSSVRRRRRQNSTSRERLRRATLAPIHAIHPSGRAKTGRRALPGPTQALPSAA